MGVYAKVVADSISYPGDRLTTLEVRYHRFVLAEMNTHRVFSRNTASSRAIPYEKMRQAVLEDPAMPVVWPAEQKGMQGGDPISDPYRCNLEWLAARSEAIAAADRLHSLGVHKSLCNRLLEPFQYITSIITATEWDGFFAQRCHEDAQPEIRVAAEAMRNAMEQSVPKIVASFEWHTPYIQPDEWHLSWDEKQMLSVARCARVSYLTHDGRRDHNKDYELYNRLATHAPAHASPFEHVATPVGWKPQGNFRGWAQLRHLSGME